MNRIPATQGYQLPPEWQYHAGTQLHWPANRQTWPGDRLIKAEQVFLDIIEILHRYEPVHLFVNNEKVKEHVFELMEMHGIDLRHSTFNIQHSTFNTQPVTFHIQQTNDVWARDCGPMFITRNKNGRDDFAIIDWEYNAWGEKYPPFEADNRLPEYVAQKYGIKRFESELVLEGGAVETNGEGILITTESVMLNDNRNPDLRKQEIEQKLKDYLGIKKIIWLKRGLAGDDTDGHVDDLARFLNEDTILAMICEDPSDVNHDALQENLDILQKSTDQWGHSLTIETLPLPETKIEGTTVDGATHVPASYANFYIANGAVLIPLYDDPRDQEALLLFENYFPGRDIHGILCTDLVWGQGSIHCITREWYGM